MKDDPILSEIYLTVRSRNWCDDIYDVSPIDSGFTEIQKKLPDLFSNPSIFCAQNEGTNFGTCRGDSGTYTNFSSVMKFFSMVFGQKST
jgi:hypothetical protein